MGKKTDINNIFQIGKNKKIYIWESKYFENKKNESNIFIFKNIEIKKFIKKKLKDYGLILHKYKIDFLESSIKIYISYSKLFKSQLIINKLNNKQKFKFIKKKYKKNINLSLKTIKLFKKKNNNRKKIINLILKNKKNWYKLLIKQKIKIIVIKKIIKLYFFYNYEIKNLSYYLKNIIINKKKLIKYYKNYLNFKKINNFSINNKNKIKKRLKILQYYKNYITKKKYNTIQNINKNNFLEKIIESLKIFTNNKFNIILNINQINNKLNFNLTYTQLLHFKKILIQLRKFKKSKFFKEGVNIFFLSIINKESSQLLTNFISNQLTLVKKHGFFLKFVKKALSLMLANKVAIATAIKIIIKGRLNGKRRSNKKILIINKNISLMNLKSKINFSKFTSYSPNGTFGVKLWIKEKSIKNNVFTTKKI